MCLCLCLFPSCSKAEVVPGSAIHDSTEEKGCGAISNSTSYTSVLSSRMRTGDHFVGGTEARRRRSLLTVWDLKVMMDRGAKPAGLAVVVMIRRRQAKVARRHEMQI